MQKVAVVVLLLVLAGCGSDADGPATKPSATREAPAATAGTSARGSTVSAPQGEPAPEALSRFRCEKDKKGTWNASGVLSNRSTSATTYQVTVHVGEATGGEEEAKTRRVPSVAAGGSVRFEVTGVPAPDGGGSCHVQVLAGR